MPQKTKAPKQVHIRVRLDQSLLDRLEKDRVANGRTLTGEIVHKLEQSYRQENMRKYIEHTVTEAVAASSASVIHTIAGHDLNKPGLKISDLKVSDLKILFT